MQAFNLSEEQIIAILKNRRREWRRESCAGGARHHTGCFYSWKGKYGGKDVSEAQRVRRLEVENWQLKHAVPDLMLEQRALPAVSQVATRQ